MRMVKAATLARQLGLTTTGKLYAWISRANSDPDAPRICCIGGRVDVDMLMTQVKYHNQRNQRESRYSTDPDTLLNTPFAGLALSGGE